MMRNIILGVTNPLFLKTLKKFPVIVRLENEFERETEMK